MAHYLPVRPSGTLDLPPMVQHAVDHALAHAADHQRSHTNARVCMIVLRLASKAWYRIWRKGELCCRLRDTIRLHAPRRLIFALVRHSQPFIYVNKRCAVIAGGAPGGRA